MDKADRDRIMTSMTEGQLSEHRRALDQLKSLMKESDGPRLTVKHMLDSSMVKVAPEGLLPIESVLDRDEMGPKPGELPPDFYLKLKGSDERVRLSDFQGRGPVALIFGSYT